jgi:hypothetical protein
LEQAIEGGREGNREGMGFEADGTREAEDGEVGEKFLVIRGEGFDGDDTGNGEARRERAEGVAIGRELQAASDVDEGDSGGKAPFAAEPAGKGIGNHQARLVAFEASGYCLGPSGGGNAEDGEAGEAGDAGGKRGIGDDGGVDASKAQLEADGEGAVEMTQAGAGGKIEDTHAAASWRRRMRVSISWASEKRVATVWRARSPMAAISASGSWRARRVA